MSDETKVSSNAFETSILGRGILSCRFARPCIAVCFRFQRMEFEQSHMLWATVRNCWASSCQGISGQSTALGRSPLCSPMTSNQRVLKQVRRHSTQSKTVVSGGETEPEREGRAGLPYQPKNIFVMSEQASVPIVTACVI